jgi:hypothetical protein
MAGRLRRNERDDEDQDFDEEFEDWADGDDDESDTVACPHCGKQVYEDAAYCPHCDRDMTDLDGRVARKPWWIIVGALACMYAFYRWITLQ